MNSYPDRTYVYVVISVHGKFVEKRRLWPMVAVEEANNMLKTYNLRQLDKEYKGKRLVSRQEPRVTFFRLDHSVEFRYCDPRRSAPWNVTPETQEAY